MRERFMDSTASNPRPRWFRAVVALTILNSLGLLTLGGLEITRRFDENRENNAMERAMLEARRNAERVRSGTIARALAQSLTILADENHLGRYPAGGEDWAAMLVDRHMIERSMLMGPAGSGVTRAYHYAPPSAEALRRWERGGNAPVIIYEDPALFSDGGNIVRADTTTEWLDRESFDTVVRRIQNGDG